MKQSLKWFATVTVTSIVGILLWQITSFEVAVFIMMGTIVGWFTTD